MKKLIALLIVAGLLVGFTGCPGSATTKKGTEDKKEKEKEKDKSS